MTCPMRPDDQPGRVMKNDDEWRDVLSPEQFHVMREKGTERPFSGEYVALTEEGHYRCAACGQVLFASESKFDSGSGWPSFTTPAAPEAVATDVDQRFGVERTEVHCRRCGAHLGHVFPDGPQPTGQRYCVNSVSLCFEPERSES
jgi:peptide-methionine (R)-S-oxide reductase